MRPALLFDVNQTLLDTAALAPHISRIFGRKLTVSEWFTSVLQHSMATTLAGDYRPFGEVALAVLEMAAAARQIELRNTDIEKIQQTMKHLPLFPEVRKSLDRLHAANFRMAVLSNSAPATLEEQLQHSGIRNYFERVLSVEIVRRYKPAPETYAAAAASLGLPSQDILMVAAHHWDLLGASRAGFRTAFLARPGKALLPGAPQPGYVAEDLAGLTTQLLAAEPAVKPYPNNASRINRFALAASVITAGMLGRSLLLLSRLRR